MQRNAFNFVLHDEEEKTTKLNDLLIGEMLLLLLFRLECVYSFGQVYVNAIQNWKKKEAIHYSLSLTLTCSFFLFILLCIYTYKLYQQITIEHGHNNNNNNDEQEKGNKQQQQ